MVTGCLTVSVVFLSVLGSSEALVCKKCSTYNYRGEPSQHTSCFDAPNEKDNTSCRTYYSHRNCKTSIEIRNGVAQNVNRDCHYSWNALSNSTTTCTATSPTATQCNHVCNSSLCNARPTLLMKQCPSNCSYSRGLGNCDYITGKCVCNANAERADCSSTPGTTVTPTLRRMCVQCNEEMNPNCAKSSIELPAATECPGSEQYCVVRKGMLVNNNDGSVVRTLISRSCSRNLYSGCLLSSPGDSLLNNIYTSYTCSATCRTNNCNTGTVSDANKAPLVCQCAGGSCTYSTTTTCKLESKYCFTTVDYFIKNDGSDYRKIKEERGCATSSTRSTGCVETKVSGTDLTKVSCHESCSESNCNTGWPARPKCAQCSGVFPSSSDSCLNSKHATPCRYPNYKYCYWQTTEASSDHDKSVSVIRSCSATKQDHKCTTTTVAGITVKVCNGTCTSDGCNSSSTISFHVMQFLVIAAATLLIQLQ